MSTLSLAHKIHLEPRETDTQTLHSAPTCGQKSKNKDRVRERERVDGRREGSENGGEEERQKECE